MSFNEMFKVPFVNLEASRLTVETRTQIEQASYQFVFPFTIRTGFVNISENGYQPNNSIPTNYTQFAKVFSGNEGIIALWDNSIEIKLTEEEPKNHFIKTVKKGDHFKGRLDTSNSGADFGKNPGGEFFGDYVSFNSNRTITVDLTYQFTKNDLYKFYMVPFDSGRDNADDNDIYFVSNCEPYYDNNGVFIFNKITFSNLKDQIAASGKTIQQFCQFGAPGESIVIPKLIYNEVGQPIDFEINKNYLVDYGVNTLSIEILGTNAFAFPIVMGRPIEKLNEFNTKIYAPRDLFMLDIKYPIVDNLSQNSNPTSTFYLANALTSIDTYYSDWLERRQANWNQEVKKNFEGFVVTNQDDTQATNSENALSVRDNRWNFLNKNVINLSYDVRASQYFSQPIDPEDTSKGNVGYIDVNLSKHNRARVFDIMNISRMAFNWLRTMPITEREITPWSTTNLPIIKGFLNNLALGIPNGWRTIENFSDVAFPQFRGLPVFIGISIYDWYVKTFWGDKGAAGKGLVPMDAFRQDTEDEVGGIVGSSSLTTSFLFSLTDKLYVDGWSKKEKKIVESKVAVSSVMLGQTKFAITNKEEDKDIVYLANPTYTVSLDPTNLPSGVDKYITDVVGSSGYILEIVGFTGIGKNPVRISAYGNDPDKVSNPYGSMVWQTSIKSFAMASGAIWNIANLFKVGYLDSFIKDGDISEFPKVIQQPNPSIGSNSFTIDVSPLTHQFYYKSFEGDKQYKDTLYNFRYELYDFSQKGINNLTELVERYEKIELDGSGFHLTWGISSEANIGGKNYIDVWDTMNKTINLSINNNQIILVNENLNYSGNLVRPDGSVWVRGVGWVKGQWKIYIDSDLKMYYGCDNTSIEFVDWTIRDGYRWRTFDLKFIGKNINVISRGSTKK